MWARASLSLGDKLCVEDDRVWKWSYPSQATQALWSPEDESQMSNTEFVFYFFFEFVILIFILINYV